MTINDIINGPEGAQNSSKQQNVGIQTTNNGFYQQSLYVAAIAQFIGCEGLASPATDVRDGIEYTFDFYHPECGKAFKVFKSGDLSEYDKYVQYPGDVAVIVDVDGYPGCQAGECACCGDRYINQEQLWTLTEARVVVADFRQHYNHSRPHGKLGYQSPVRFAAQNPRPASFVEAGQNHPTQLHTNHASD